MFARMNLIVELASVSGSWYGFCSIKRRMMHSMPLDTHRTEEQAVGNRLCALIDLQTYTCVS